MDASTAQARSQTYAALAQDFARPQEGLEAEYARLFVGPGRPVAHPYESVYREGRVMGDCSLAVRQSYAAEGLGPADHSLPDHVAVELEFMAHLARREAEARERGDEERALVHLRQQEAFLGEHLGRWLPRFCQQVLAGEAPPFYARLAQRAWEHVAQDMAQVRAWLSTTEPADEGGRWTAAVGSACTLCGLCARLCPREALWLTQDEGEACLLFDPALCNGCAACQQWCPEGAVNIELSSPVDRSTDSTVALSDSEGSRSSPGRVPLDRNEILPFGGVYPERSRRTQGRLCSAPQNDLFNEGSAKIRVPAPVEDQCILIRSSLIPCPGCGRPYLSAALLAQVRERAAGDDEGLRRRLALCPACKASPISSLVKEG